MATTATITTAPPTTINGLMGRLLARYEAEGDLDPLLVRFTFAGLWEDLADEAGEALPSHVEAALRTIGGERPQPEHVPLAVAHDAMRRDVGAGAWLGAD